MIYKSSTYRAINYLVYLSSTGDNIIEEHLYNNDERMYWKIIPDTQY